jgi:hypothetical protein
LISHRPDPVISPDYSLATAEVYRRAVLTLPDTPSSFSVLMGTLGKHSYPTIERQTNRNHSPTTSSIATSVSIPNGSNGGASAGSHAYCTKCGLGPLFELKMTAPSGAANETANSPLPCAFAYMILTWIVARHAISEKLTLYPAMEKHLGDVGVQLAKTDKDQHLSIIVTQSVPSQVFQTANWLRNSSRTPLTSCKT